MTKLFLLIAAFCLTLTACGSNQATNPAAQPVTGVNPTTKFVTPTYKTSKITPTTPFNLSDKLQAQGLTVSPNGPVSTFTVVTHVIGNSLLVNQENLVYYEFPDNDSANAIKVSPEGASFSNSDGAFVSISVVRIGPHVYKKDNILVLYIGSDSTILNALKAVLGNQVAGF